MIWFVFFAAVSLSDGAQYVGVRSNLPFTSEQSCYDWLADVDNESREYDYVASLYPDARISFACASASELGVFLGEKGA